MSSLYLDVKINLLLAIDRVKIARRQIKISLLGEQAGFDALDEDEQYDLDSLHSDFQNNVVEALDKADDLKAWLEMVLEDIEKEDKDGAE